MELKNLFGALCSTTYAVRSLRTLLSRLPIIKKGTADVRMFPKVRQSDNTSSKTRILIVYYLTSYPATTILSLTALTILLAVQKIAGIRTASLPLKWVELRFFLPQLSLWHLYHDFFFMYNVAAKKSLKKCALCKLWQKWIECISAAMIYLVQLWSTLQLKWDNSHRKNFTDRYPGDENFTGKSTVEFQSAII